MVFIFRVIIVTLASILICVLGSLYCLFSPRNPQHVKTFSHLFGRLSVLFGLKVEMRIQPDVDKFGSCIYIANHQNNYDMVTVSGSVQNRTVTVGKHSLLWVPFFGPLYWLTGNILIDRNNRAKAHGTINQLVEHIHKNNISVFMFPEGTRSRGRGLMPFKTGAFHAAIAAGVPIVPICTSNIDNKIKLNRWNNGHVIIEMLPPVDTSQYGKDQIRELTEHCRQLMAEKIDALNHEIELQDRANQ